MSFFPIFPIFEPLTNFANTQWIASTSCSTLICLQTSGHLYDPSDSHATNVNFSISYLSGSTSGPIVWDQVSIGGYVTDNQALGLLSSFRYIGPKLMTRW